MSGQEILDIRRNGTAVTLRFQSRLPIDANAFPFGFDCGSEWAACLLASTVRSTIENEIAAIRKSEYERGYRDGRAKRAKESWFASSFSWRWVRR